MTAKGSRTEGGVAAQAKKAPRTRVTTLVYVSLTLGQRAISFLLIPFLTAVLTPAEYGQIATLAALSAFLTILFGLGLETAVFRAHALSHDDPQSGLELRAISGYLLVVVPVVATLLAAACWLADVRIATAPPYLLASAVFAAGLSAPVYAYSLPVLRGIEALGRFVCVSVVAVVAQVGLTVGLVVVARLGLEGIAISTAVSSALMYATALAVVGGGSGRISWRALGKPLRFTLPLVPHQLLNWMTAFVDRVIMISLLTAAMAGIYSLSYQASVVLGLVFTELNRAFMPRYTRLGAAADLAELSRLIRLHLAMMAGVTAAAIISVPVIAPIMFRGDFDDAGLYLGWLLFAQLMYGCYYLPTNLVTLARGRSDRMWLASGAGATSNVALNFLLLPLVGVWGAVVATVVAYAAMACVAWRIEMRSGDEIRAVISGRFVLGVAICVASLSFAAISPALGSTPLTIVAYGTCALVALLGPGRYILSLSSSTRGVASGTPGASA